MVPIESAPVERIASHSTSELASILTAVQKRFRLVWIAVLVGGFSVLVSARHADGNVLKAALLFSVVALAVAALLDRYRRSIKVEFKFEGLAANVTTALTGAFEDLRQCKSVWQVLSEGQTFDQKRNAGATGLNTRTATRLGFESLHAVRGSSKFPSIKVGKTDLFFLPDVILVVTGSSFATLAYSDVQVRVGQVRFIEDDPVPSDATVVGQTWKYVNKSGGPDRRFSSNRQLPICWYGEMEIQSSGGLNAKIQYSIASAGDRFAKVVELLAKLGASGARLEPLISYKVPRALPAVAYCLCVIAVGAIFGALSYLSPRLEAAAPIVPSSAMTSPVPATKGRSAGGPSVQPSVVQPKKAQRSEPSVGAPLSISPFDNQTAPNPTPRARPGQP